MRRRTVWCACARVCVCVRCALRSCACVTTGRGGGDGGIRTVHAISDGCSSSRPRLCTGERVRAPGALPDRRPRVPGGGGGRAMGARDRGRGPNGRRGKRTEAGAGHARWLSGWPLGAPPRVVPRAPPCPHSLFLTRRYYYYYYYSDGGRLIVFFFSLPPACRPAGVFLV